MINVLNINRHNSIQIMDNNFNHQDWETVVLKKDRNTLKKEGKLEKESVQKVFGKGNNQKPLLVSAKVLDGDEVQELPKFSENLKNAIKTGRQNKKDADGKSMTQADLAKACNVNASVIRDYEAGKGIPNPQVLIKMSQALGVKLNRKM
jgi:ribosome-binding protein aMBF1 (putative translation factor)